MTWLRISDILQLSWEHIQMGQDGGYLIRLCTEKTEEETNLPISDETLALCGERSEGLVFKGLKRHMVNHPLKEWIKSAGLTRRITFHTMRHSFATLLAANGVDIQNLRGICMWNDELAGWFKNFNRYNKGSDEEYWLKLFNANPSISDRKGVKNSVYISRPFISVVGTIQNGILNELAQGSRTSTGFIDRLLFVMPHNQDK